MRSMVHFFLKECTYSITHLPYWPTACWHWMLVCPAKGDATSAMVSWLLGGKWKLYSPQRPQLCGLTPNVVCQYCTLCYCAYSTRTARFGGKCPSSWGQSTDGIALQTYKWPPHVQFTHCSNRHGQQQWKGKIPQGFRTKPKVTTPLGPRVTTPLSQQSMSSLTTGTLVLQVITWYNWLLLTVCQHLDRGSTYIASSLTS